MEHRAKSDESVTSRQSFNYAQDKQAADSRQPFGFKDVTKLSFRSNGESKMRKLINCNVVGFDGFIRSFCWRDGAGA
jgi:hypothetical protein